MRVSVATHSGQHLLLSLFFLPLNINHWNRCELVFYCGFSLIFLVKNYTEHPFMCLSVSHISYLMRYLFKPFVCVCVLITQSCPTCPTLCNPIDSLVPLSMESSRQEYWSGLPFPSSGIFWIHGMTGLLHWQADSLPPEPPGKPFYPFLPGCIVF